MLRIYELRETSGFNSADFFSLFNNDQSTLSTESVRKQEFLIKPGDIKPLSIQLESEIRALGFFVAFRQVDTAQWRVIMPITRNKTQSAVINLRGNKLVLEPVGTGH
jgi:type VI secretion system protein VasD